MGKICYSGDPIENEILMCLRASQKRKNDISLQDPIGMDGEGNEIALIDVLGTDGGEVHDEVEKKVSLAAVRAFVESGLQGREKTVVKMRYGLLDGRVYAQQEVADKLGISRSYVSQLGYCKWMKEIRVAIDCRSFQSAGQGALKGFFCLVGFDLSSILCEYLVSCFFVVYNNFV